MANLIEVADPADERLADYVKDIPTFVITHPHTALLGAARALAELERVTL